MTEYQKPLWEHQKRTIDLALSRAKAGKGLALFFEQGTGKTRTALEILTGLYRQDSRLLRTFIVCPIVVVRNWQNEIKKYTVIPEPLVVPLTGTGHQRAESFEKYVFQGGSNIVITNYESLLMKDLQPMFWRWQPEVLIVDESQKVKSMQAKRTKELLRISRTASYKYLLSGTPVLNSPMDLFSQYLVMDDGLTFGDNFYAFRARYFRDANAGMPAHIKFPNWKIKEGSVEEINRLVNETSVRVTKDECLDLPPLVKQVFHVEQTSDQKRAYEEMKKSFITFIKDKACVAQLALTKALRLQQIVSGFIKLDDGSEVDFKENPRLKALEDLLTDLTPNHKVIVWACFKRNYVQISDLCKRLKIRFVECHGDVSQKEKDDAVTAFTIDESCRVFIGNQSAAGVGISLTASDYSIYYSRNFSLEADLQSEARNHRGGSEIHSKITRIDLVAPGTIDEIVLGAIKNKEQIGESLIRRFCEQEDTAY